MTNASKVAATFAAWLDVELKARHWSNREIARRMGVSHAAINNVRRGENRPTSDLCIKIAQALDMPVEPVFRVAGILPPAQEGTDEEQRLVHLFRKLDKRDKDTMLRIAAAMAKHTEAEPDSPLPLTETQP